MNCLYAKILWVSGQLTCPPPLIPYDGVVKKLLNVNNLNDWTVLDKMEEYASIVKAIEDVSNYNPALWELEHWNNSVTTKYI